jgi:hypothetical protein
VNDSVPTTRQAPAKKPFPKVVAITTGLLLVTAILVVPKLLSTPGGDAPPGPTKSDSAPAANPQLESEAMQRFSEAQAASASGDYSAAMKAAAAMHTLSVRADWAGQARFSWGTRADSIAGALVTACPVEREMLLKRDPKANIPACPAKSW